MAVNEFIIDEQKKKKLKVYLYGQFDNFREQKKKNIFLVKIRMIATTTNII